MMEWYIWLGISLGSLIVVILVVLLVYHCNERQTRFIYKPIDTNAQIKQLLDENPYSPTFYLPTAYLKIYSWLRKKFTFEYTREIFALSDGGEIALDFYPNNFYYLDSPVLVLISGLNGGSSDAFIAYTAIEAKKQGFRSVVYNKRGFERVELKGIHVNSWVRLEDFDEVLSYVRQRCPQASICTMGFSMGANFTQFYLGEKGKIAAELGITASVAVSPLHDLSKGSYKVDNNLLVRKFLVKSCVKAIQKNKDSKLLNDIMLERGIKIEELDSIKTIRELDDKYTSKILGLENCDQYYYWISGVHRAEHIRTPLLCINSERDPLVDFAGIDVSKVMNSNYYFQVLVKNGGHIEYSHGWSNQNWAALTGLEYLKRVVNGQIVYH